VAYSPFPNFDEAKEKILEHDVCVQYSSAVIDLIYTTKLRDRFDGSVLDERAKILQDAVLREGYTKKNISEHAVIDTARKRKIHYFLSNKKYKIKTINKVLSFFK
jgi:hypothetical protein